jgi:hypothetical protein
MPVLLLLRGLGSVPAAGTFPAVKVEANFSVLTGWTDITPYADFSGGQQVTITRGSNRVESPVIRYDAGTCQIPLDNTDRRFDPTNLSGAYTGGIPVATFIKPCANIRVSATFTSVTYRLFNGTADSWDLSYSPPSDAQATVSCTDGFRVLAVQARTARSSFVGGGEDAGARVTRILNDCGWPYAKRSIVPGDSTLQPTLLGGTPIGVVPLAVANAGGTQTTTGVAAVSTLAPLDELQLTAETEMGELYVNGNGFLVFRNRHALWTDTRSLTAQASFGDLAGFVPWQVQWHGNGVTANPGAQSQLIGGITAGNSYTASAWFYSVQGWSQVQLAVNWWTAGSGYISTTGGPVINIPPNAAVLVTNGPMTAPALATQYTLVPQMVGTPASSVIMTAAPQQNPAAGDLSAAAVAWSWSVNNSATVTNLGYIPAALYPGELAYASVTPAYDDTTLWNGAVIANQGGNLQQAADATSQQLPPDGFGPHVYDSENLIADSDFQALGYAQWIVLSSKNPELRYSAITIDPIADPVNLFPQVLGREIGDRITITRRPPGGGTPNARDVFIRGVQHQFTDSTWLTTWILEDATFLPPQFIMDDAVNGVLDTSSLGF